MTFNELTLWLFSTLPFYTLTLTIILALLLDKYLGEARQYHYLVGFGWLAQQIEKHLNTFQTDKKSDETQPLRFNIKKALLGSLAWVILVLPIALLYFLYLNHLTWYWQILLDAIVLYLAIGLNSLHQHAMQVYQPLKENNLVQARHFTGYLVSRETAELTPTEMSRATVESMLENGHDSVIASIVYFIIGGAPLVIIHRFANTLDAMWGYRTLQFNSFGFASARLDDLLGFISAKICTLLYAIQGKFLTALANAYKQGNTYKSHNGGWVMAAGATVMNKKLGGTAQYNGKRVESVTLGCGENIAVEDIPKSILIVKRAAIILTLIVLLWQTISFIAFTH
ncbi:CobD/CbiB family cobalamin biosynthesis protein [Colwellia sp. UCD-KL20]|uniref:cobalamin biosynthesis protein CobD/CbiB n=1 Tax=Colwellia sp. UCD-KL20 TaxID=1917165 RepID=UPI002570CF0A|nr:CobD/CbiB family cobalamin biosynthesis protein [Colwellia sp. UCD-KL20]